MKPATKRILWPLLDDADKKKPEIQWGICFEVNKGHLKLLWLCCIRFMGVYSHVLERINLVLTSPREAIKKCDRRRSDGEFYMQFCVMDPQRSWTISFGRLITLPGPPSIWIWWQFVSAHTDLNIWCGGGQRPQRHADRWQGNKTSPSMIIPAVNDLANDPVSQRRHDLRLQEKAAIICCSWRLNY